VASEAKDKKKAAANGGKSKTKVYQNFIAGKWCDAANGQIVENRNPAMWSDLIGTFPHSPKEDVDRAVKSAQKAYKTWRLVPPPAKAKLFFRLVEILTERKEQYAFDMTREMGKPIFETRGDVQEAIDTAWYASGEGYRMFGKTVPSELNNKFNMTIRMPIGVCGLISPWNFPMAIPSWKIIPALMCGNTVVFKPAELVPLSAHNFVEAILDAGFPPEIINIVHGSGKEVGAHIVNHPDIPVISFTGSSAVGKVIGRDASYMLKRVSMELGGKNAQIVMNDADLDHAVDCATWGGFGTTGQRCTATSRVICEEGIHDAFVEKYIKAAKKLKIGYGNDEGITMGPCVSEGQRKTVMEYVEIGKNVDKATLAYGGKALTKGDHADGWFHEPTIFTDVKPGMRIAQEEIFGPVVSILKAKNFDDALKISNNIDYGLSSAVFTKNVDQAFRSFRDIEAGITYINAATIGAEAHMPFGGMKATGNGHREGGWEVYEFYSETKACYIDYSGKLQRAQIDE